MTKRKVHSGSGNRRNDGNKSRYSNRPPRSNGSAENSPRPPRNNHQNNILPPPHILQEYEYATDGAAKRIIEMAELEQQRRHQWEDEYLRFHKKSLRLGQLFGFLLLLAVVYSTMELTANGHDSVAQVLAGSAFISVALSSIFSGRNSKKNYPRKPRDNR